MRQQRQISKKNHASPLPPRQRSLAAGLGLLFASLPALAQQAPTLAAASSGYTLNIPYLEVNNGTSRFAVSARFSSSSLSSFTLDPASVLTTPLLTTASQAAQFSVQGGSYRLNLPYLEFSSGGSTLAFKANFTSSNLAQFALDPSSVAQVAVNTGTGTVAAPGSVTVSKVNEQTVGSYSLASSSRLKVSWTAPTGSSSVDHYEVTASEAVQNTSVKASVSSSTQATLTGLKAATPYSIVVKACANSACSSAGAASAVSATTSEEYWQLQGSGASVSGLTKVVSDGNARISATRFGAEAGSNANRLQLYYGPQPVQGSNASLSVAYTSLASSASNSSSYLAFTSLAGQSGLISPSGPSSGSSGSTGSGSSNTLAQIATGQGVPLSSALGGGVRLFFEATAADGKTRIYSVDSKDGYVGRDFNSGSASTCSTAADYQSTGGCAATVLIGVEGDSSRANSKLKNARQHKVAHPTLDDWRWDGAAGTFMLFTTDQVSGCSTYGMNHGYAVWDGSLWNVQYASDGCPKLFKSAQAMLPMHLGGARYKAYYGDPSIATGKVTSSSLPFLGPKQLIYADGSVSATASQVDFEDWEATSAARNVVFLWPNNSKLDDAAEGYIDDFHFLTPTGSLDLQVMYMAITDGVVPPISAAAVLLNP